MDALFQKLADSLLSEGVMGVIVVGLSYGCWKLQQKLSEVQDQRVKDVLKLADATHALASALDRNTETLRAFVSED